MAGSNALRRALLLVILAFGVAGMHTFGHEGIMSFAAASADPAAMTHDIPVTRADPGPLAHSGTTPQHPGSPHEPAGPLDVCLAILGFAIILTLAAFGARHAFMPAIWCTMAGAVRGNGRSPPLPPPMTGLQIAAFSVLRI